MVASSASRVPVPVVPTPADFQPTLERAVARHDDLDAFVRRSARQGLRNVFFVGCGGSLLAMESTRFLLERRSSAAPSCVLNASEFCARRPALLGPGSLVVVASHSGTTTETLDAARLARAAGARVLFGLA